MFLDYFSKRPLVNVVRLSGVIGSLGPLRSGLTAERLEPLLVRAFKGRNLEAVALAINSPGGSAVQSALIAGRVRALAEERKVPVIAFVEDVAASGGYWLACAGDEIVANESSLVGSIGVVSASFGFERAIERLGIERRLHTAGERKVLLDPFEPEDPEDVARLKSIQSEIHETFKALVRERRGERLKADEATLYSGEFWTGRRGLELGLVDRLGEMRSLVTDRFGKKVRINVLRPRRGLLASLRRGASIGGLASPLAWADGAIEAAEARALWARYGL